MKKLALLYVSLMMLGTMALMFVPSASARPASISCFDDSSRLFSSCDGFLPPGSSNCPELFDHQFLMFDNLNRDIGTLHLWESGASSGCSSEWAAVEATNPSICFTTKFVTVQETNGDTSFANSNQGTNRKQCKGNNTWNSTYMTGESVPAGECAFGETQWFESGSSTTYTTTTSAECIVN